jgi:hypothetical protein
MQLVHCHFVLWGAGVKSLRGGAAPHPLTPQKKRDRPLASVGHLEKFKVLGLKVDDGAIGPWGW